MVTPTAAMLRSQQLLSALGVEPKASSALIVKLGHHAFTSLDFAFEDLEGRSVLGCLATPLGFKSTASKGSSS